MEFSAPTGTAITVPKGRSQALEWKMERYGIAVAFGLIAMLLVLAPQLRADCLDGSITAQGLR